ncbi:hypothetical protein FB451DRAFT_82834 [Mycena latifolia]|nr:hypothetical protein FB451DRAFT_82834 [Mycena latifolia]
MQVRQMIWMKSNPKPRRDRPISSLEAMKEFLDLPEDVATKLRIEELYEQYEEDLERLYMAQAEDYMDEAEDRYYAFQEAYPEIEDAYSDFRKEDSRRWQQIEWDHALAHTTSTHQTRLEKLRAPPTEIEFPQSIDEYRLLKSKETQHRIARFLLLETDEQREKMLSEFGWAWRQVTPLKNEFQANTEFQEELRVSIADLNVADPRKR